MLRKNEFQGRLTLKKVFKLNISNLIFFNVTVSSCMSWLNCSRQFILLFLLQVLLFHRSGVQIDTMICTIFFHGIPQVILLFFGWALCLLTCLLRNWDRSPARRRLPFWISSIYRGCWNIIISVLSRGWNRYIIFCQSLLSINLLILIIVSCWWSST